MVEDALELVVFLSLSSSTSTELLYLVPMLTTCVKVHKPQEDSKTLKQQQNKNKKSKQREPLYLEVTSCPQA